MNIIEATTRIDLERIGALVEVTEDTVTVEALSAEPCLMEWRYEFLAECHEIAASNLSESDKSRIAVQLFRWFSSALDVQVRAHNRALVDLLDGHLNNDSLLRADRLLLLGWLHIDNQCGGYVEGFEQELGLPTIELDAPFSDLALLKLAIFAN